ncbi:MAG: hypothetical protein Q9227_007775 [Pyrenula ochraceoflavens]
MDGKFRPSMLRRLSSRFGMEAQQGLPARSASVAGIVRPANTSAHLEPKDKNSRRGLGDANLPRPYGPLVFDAKDKDKEDFKIPRRPVSATARPASVLTQGAKRATAAPGAGAVILGDPELLRRRSRMMVGQCRSTGDLALGERRQSRMLELGLDVTADEAKRGRDTGVRVQVKEVPPTPGQDRNAKTEAKTNSQGKQQSLLKRAMSYKDKGGARDAKTDLEAFVRRQKARVERWTERESQEKVRRKSEVETGVNTTRERECKVM